MQCTPSSSVSLQRLRQRLLSHAMVLCGGDLHCAEDLVQDVFVRCLRRAEPTLDMPSAWFQTVMRNRAIQLWAQHSIRSHPSDPLLSFPDGAPEPLEQLCQNEASLAVRKALDQLPSRYRRPMEARYLKSQTLSEVGRSLDLPFHTVRTQIRRARERLVLTLPRDP